MADATREPAAEQQTAAIAATDGNSDSAILKGLLEVAKSQQETLKILAESMKGIERGLGTLERFTIADHAMQPLPKRDIKYESAWKAVLAKVREGITRANIWKDGMDATLIFVRFPVLNLSGKEPIKSYQVALFVTIVTTFVGPVVLNLSQNSADVTNELLRNLTMIVYETSALNGLRVPQTVPQPLPFKPARSDEILALLWFTSLIMSTLCAILAIFGRQWVAHYTKKPDGKNHMENSMRYKEREEFAKKYLIPVLDSLHPMLLVSISLFVAGLLYQLWTLSLFGTGKSPILITGSSIGSAFVLAAVAVIALAFLHAVRHEESPFSTPMSKLARRMVSRSFALPFSYKDDHKNTRAIKYMSEIIPQMTDDEHLEPVASVPLVTNWTPSDMVPVASKAIIRLLESDTSLKVKITVAQNLRKGDSYLISSERNAMEKETCAEMFHAFCALHWSASNTQVEYRKWMLIGAVRAYSFTVYLNWSLFSSTVTPSSPDFCFFLAEMLNLASKGGDIDPVWLVGMAEKECLLILDEEGEKSFTDVFSKCDVTGLVAALRHLYNPEFLSALGRMPEDWITKYVSVIASSTREVWDLSKGEWKGSFPNSATLMIYHLFDNRDTVPVAGSTDFSPLIASIINASKTETCYDQFSAMTKLLSCMDTFTLQRQERAAELLDIAWTNLDRYYRQQKKALHLLIQLSPTTDELYATLMSIATTPEIATNVLNALSEMSRDDLHLQLHLRNFIALLRDSGLREWVKHCIFFADLDYFKNLLEKTHIAPSKLVSALSIIASDNDDILVSSFNARSYLEKLVTVTEMQDKTQCILARLDGELISAISTVRT